jgi:lipopolysaccharide/colanic/teichoic acid biosynthesis glycosyltransferase
MVGQNGKVFSLFRFRTMSAHQPERNTESKLTRVGRFLRDYSLDHLPMLINLLKGDLTIIGPRPMEIEVVDLKDPLWQRYFLVKPGLFNYAILKLGKLWTSSRVGHQRLNQELELEYREKQSAAADLQLVMQFLRALMASHGNIKARGVPDPDLEKIIKNK